jgi:Fe/S biogenesis protein NfuA
MSEALVQITEKARTKIAEFLSAEGRPGLALRMAINGRGPGGFQYRLGFVNATDQSKADPSFDAGGFTVVVDAESVDNLRGATVDYVEASYGAGFKIENPNPLWRDEVAVAVQKVLDEDINPAVGSHGGHVTLLDVKEGRAFIQLGGGCQGCGMVDVTLKQGIEVRVKELVPAIHEVIDTTDHAGGTNPYFQPSRGGESPLAK